MVSTSPQTPRLALHTRGISSAYARNKHIQKESPAKGEPFVPAVKESAFLKAYLLQGEHDYSARYAKAVGDALTLQKTELQALYPAEYNSLRSRRQQARERHIKFADCLKDLRDWLIHLGPRPYEGLTVDRIKSAKGYVPNNLRWETKFVQTQNRSVTKWHPMPEGPNLTTKQLATKLNLSYATLYKRLATGWTIERLLQDAPPKTLKDWKFPDELTRYCEPQYRQTRKHFTTPRIDWFIDYLESVVHGEERGNELSLNGLAFSNLLKHLAQAKQDRQNIDQATKDYENKKLRELIAIYEPPSTSRPVTAHAQKQLEAPKPTIHRGIPTPQTTIPVHKEPVHVATPQEIEALLVHFKEQAAMQEMA